MNALKVTQPGSFASHLMCGYYVEGRYYGTAVSQAEARARELSRQYGRPVDVTFAEPGGGIERVLTCVAGTRGVRS